MLTQWRSKKADESPFVGEGAPTWRGIIRHKGELAIVLLCQI
ncbi:hypothetical protein NBRC103581_00541 [Gluconobacter wancherniae NBRC 103581]|nr:hypothetical protein NBRC103581_00541 [Gluconobacter wancherniae NBRC 103581]